MAEDIQGLLQRIKEKGFQESEAERDKLLADAKRQADDIVAAARAERDKLLADAKQESAKLLQAGEDKLKQAARDVVIALDAELKRLLSNLLKGCVTQTLSPELMSKLVLVLAENYGKQKGEVTSVELLVPEAQLAELDGLIKSQLGSAFKGGVKLMPVRGIDAGLQVSFNGESVFHDFSADAVTELLCAYANPRLAALLRQ